MAHAASIMDACHSGLSDRTLRRHICARKRVGAKGRGSRAHRMAVIYAYMGATIVAATTGITGISKRIIKATTSRHITDIVLTYAVRGYPTPSTGHITSPLYRVSIQDAIIAHTSLENQAKKTAALIRGGVYTVTRVCETTGHAQVSKNSTTKKGKVEVG